MALLGIQVYPASILRQETEPVTEFGPALQTLIDDMFETMHAAQGIGLAAPQVGRRERLAVVQVEDTRLVIINPEITHAEGKIRGEEGCLSIPDIFGEVERSARVVVQAVDASGEPFTVEAGELLSRCLQHEIDHLHGKLFIDYLSMLKRGAALAKWETMKSKYPGLVRDVSLETPPEKQAESL